MNNLIIDWPAIIQLKSDDELILIKNNEQFLSDPNIQGLILQPEDRLIDSQGRVFFLKKFQNITLTSAFYSLSLIEIQEMLQRHLSCLGTCCVAKFDASSIPEAIKFVLNE
jgi:hypothetical protein